MINPYQNVNFQTAIRVPSCSHEHCENQQTIDRLINGGLKHLCISNYYPSKPLYPVGEQLTIPSDVISSPNAEHHSMSINGLKLPTMHINSLGSFFESGKPSGETPIGCDGASVDLIVKKILNELQFDDAGGVTINHPSWTGLTIKQMMHILDVDYRVLGSEIFNSFYDDEDSDASMVEDLKKWDAILKTGRRCWGFCVADHQGQLRADWQGRNILLVDEFTEHACLKAYRDGAFYGQIENTDLKFTNISYDNNQYDVSIANGNKIKVVIDGVETEYADTSVSVNVPITATYVRAEGYSNDDIIFTNPIMIRERKQSRNNMTQNILLFYS